MTPHPNMREAYGLALLELGRRHPEVVALEADLGNSTRSVLFGKAFPERYFQMGIAEQNMAATAAGLALAGKIPFIHSFAVFATGRDLRPAAQLHLHPPAEGARLRVEQRALRFRRRQDPPVGRGHDPHARAAVHDRALARGRPGDGPHDGVPDRLPGAGLHPHQPLGPADPLPRPTSPTASARSPACGRARRSCCSPPASWSAARSRRPSSWRPRGWGRRSTTSARSSRSTSRRSRGRSPAHGRSWWPRSTTVSAAWARPFSRPCGRPRTRRSSSSGIADCFGLSAACYDEILNHFGLTAPAVADAALRMLEGGRK